MPEACRLRGVHLGYADGPDIVRGLDLTIAEGESVAILGPSGGGKSTILKALAGLLPARKGSIEILGHTQPAAPAPGRVGYIPQRLGLVRHASVLRNVLQGGLHQTPAWRSLTGRVDPDLRERAHEALDAVGLLGHADKPVHRLSGGQQRRVATARALVQRPRLLLADEFLGELDPDTVETVLVAVERLRDETGMTVVLVEHHLDQALRFADRVLQCKDGRLRQLDLEAAG